MALNPQLPSVVGQQITWPRGHQKFAEDIHAIGFEGNFGGNPHVWFMHTFPLKPICWHLLGYVLVELLLPHAPWLLLLILVPIAIFNWQSWCSKWAFGSSVVIIALIVAPRLWGMWPSHLFPNELFHLGKMYAAYVCIYTNTYINTRIHTYIHIYTHKQSHAYTRAASVSDISSFRRAAGHIPCLHGRSCPTWELQKCLRQLASEAMKT